ncbi:DNA-binding NarL/FixJ family response regulator [Clostridium acetobutylicum]|uniref:Stage 0 sporulation protein A homolog n=1 Tax=Clostridium acetobutylicum (strain ATCC 824 / DSM 792 / JCM 1419 / IAM 19013 / LMG 5710 / NBRC 13948 / NRRL B-527 / VKM B-1787 / 2291 / W) TaxID=272562 RepID=Q97F16_CLOAB|nr:MULTISPECIES: response regulator transcription factor [Clostridium]AAK80881.1 Response regulator (CheY-like receiver domain and HTH-type DNA-binding domain) [Clostridium acetobutylicum ATCC 824]ADZ21983.1 Response regulator (CheY-like receiver domain and HTH-type DNA-binding domain) [Clostridium acetobutylicum EA 2018]AEI34304.1 response regulator [Clostridium acetobutylicum DSM 1731]AWV78707.1 DNA-binding response regulator [Clostridium acetobutylicum]MBC2393570.1 response regulator transc
MDNINVVIADDEKLIRDGLKIILNANDEINVIGVAENGIEAAEICKREKVDVVLTDIRMPVCDGVKATKIIKNQFSDIKVLVLTTFKDDEYIFEAMKNGANGYILKDTSYEIIIDAVKSVYKGNVVVNPEIASKMVSGVMKTSPSSNEIKEKYKLTDRQIEIIIAIGSGLSNKEIAEKQYVTEGTVKNHITEILSKLEMRDRTQIAIFALKNELV